MLARPAAAVAARIHLDAGLVEAGIPSQATHRDDVFEFREPALRPRLRQALTDTLRWSLETDAAGGRNRDRARGRRSVEAPRAQAECASRARSSSATCRLRTSRRWPTTLTNEEMAALHFGAYYELLQNSQRTARLPTLGRRP